MPKQLPPADGRHAGPRVVPYESMQLQLLTHHLQENKYEQAVKVHLSGFLLCMYVFIP